MPSTVERPRDYVPAMGRHLLLPLYDPFTRLLGVAPLHRRLVEQADVEPGHRVLEVGCGTGNLALACKRAHPDATVVGLDPDPRALARALRKAGRAEVAVAWDRGFAEDLPYDVGSFDRVLSSLMLHHLEPSVKREALLEARRVLVPGGALHLLDLGGVEDASDGHMARRMHRDARFRENVGNGIPTLLREAGFVDVAEVGHGITRVMGRVTHVRGTARRT